MSVDVMDTGPRRVSRTVRVRAPAADLFAIVADPRRHHELDGSGTVQETVNAPARLAPDARFIVRMKMYGVPYLITSRVTRFTEDRVVEWCHPAGHRWRWEFAPASADETLVTETFDYSGLSSMRARTLEFLGMPRKNAAGIESTLRQLQARYDAA